MRLIIIGCEYAGKSTLLKEILKWGKKKMGSMAGGHDHFDFPPDELPEDEREKLAALGPRAKELFQRHMLSYHHRKIFYDRNDHFLVGFHIQEVVYAPLYYGYDPRSKLARDLEREIISAVPDTVLILVKAAASAIKERMKTSPHSHQIVKESDVELVLKRFEEEFDDTMIRRKFILDTTETDVAGTLSEFLDNMEAHFSEYDMIRILTHEALHG